MTQPAATPPPPAAPQGAPPPYPSPTAAAGSAPGAAPLAATTAKRKQQPPQESSVKETLESILVAFILAFVFRAFVVEAFVIPTGSMAPTLLGAHMRFRCDDCGYRFDANYSPEQSGSGGDDLYIPTRAKSRPRAVYCPNCGYKIPSQDPTDQLRYYTADKVLFRFVRQP